MRLPALFYQCSQFYFYCQFILIIYFYIKLMLQPIIIRTCIFLTLTTITHTHFIQHQNLFIYEPNPYNSTQSTEYAYFAGLAYCPKKCLQAWNCSAAKNLTNFGEVTHVTSLISLSSCFIGYQKVKDMIIVSCRGSRNIDNWLEDFSVEKIKYPACKGCEIHAGFMFDYLEIEIKINDKMQSLMQAHPTATILTTGHSLGAALSIIAAIRLKAKYNKTTVIHNYGSPRLANPALAQYINTRIDTIYRVVHNRDIVPHLPPEAFGYHHPAYEVLWNEQMSDYRVCDQSGQDDTCSNHFYPHYSISDHNFYFDVIDGLKC